MQYLYYVFAAPPPPPSTVYSTHVGKLVTVVLFKTANISDIQQQVLGPGRNYYRPKGTTVCGARADASLPGSATLVNYSTTSEQEDYEYQHCLCTVGWIDFKTRT